MFGIIFGVLILLAAYKVLNIIMEMIFGKSKRKKKYQKSRYFKR